MDEDANAWREQAACREYPMPAFNDYWLPVGKLASRTMPPEAREICARCPVLRECKAVKMREEGLKKTSDREGNVAGLTPMERAKLARWRTRQKLKPWEDPNDFEYVRVRKVV